MRVTIDDICLAVVRLIDDDHVGADAYPVCVDDLRARWTDVGLRQNDLEIGLEALQAKGSLQQVAGDESAPSGLFLTSKGRAQFGEKPRSLQGWATRLRSEWILALAARRVSGRLQFRPRRAPGTLLPLG